MKIVFHDRFREVYSSDPAAELGRMDCIVEELLGDFAFVQSSPASEEDLLLVHTKNHVERIKRNKSLYEIALLAVGGAIEAASIALQGEPAFALIRPPGHHASPDSCWGFCWFNNIAIAVEKLRRAGEINSALIIDIDLHYGDGTDKIFSKNNQIKYHHLDTRAQLEKFLQSTKTCDMIAISAGFDRHVADWGGLLETEDYYILGNIIGDYARQTCGGKVFAVLEGGYNHSVLGKNVKSLLMGLSEL